MYLMEKMFLKLKLSVGFFLFHHSKCVCFLIAWIAKNDKNKPLVKLYYLNRKIRILRGLVSTEDRDKYLEIAATCADNITRYAFKTKPLFITSSFSHGKSSCYYTVYFFLFIFKKGWSLLLGIRGGL